jgi:putative Holliday junction resolvase
MVVATIADLLAGMAKDERLLGLDVGERTIGLALSDVRRRLASPARTIRRTKLGQDALIIRDLIVAEGVGGLIIGLPVDMDGREGKRAEAARHFGQALDQRLAELGAARPLAFWDERLSTAAVERVLRDEADLSRERRRDLVDKMAAAYILQGALDAAHS